MLWRKTHDPTGVTIEQWDSWDGQYRVYKGKNMETFGFDADVRDPNGVWGGLIISLQGYSREQTMRECSKWKAKAHAVA